MVPIAKRVARLAAGRLAIFRLINARRGWDAKGTPEYDVRWALEQIATRLDAPLPASLVGHSLGGRAALLCADREELRSVVALAPWVHADDLPSGDVHARVLIVHGSRDGVASPERSEALARALATRAAVSYVTVNGGTHGMLRRRELFDGLAAAFAVATLPGARPLDGRPSDGVLGRVLAGESFIEL
jgi:dienelactone hydrolase